MITELIIASINNVLHSYFAALLLAALAFVLAGLLERRTKDGTQNNHDKRVG